MSSLLSYLNLTIYVPIWATYSQIEPAITTGLRWLLIGFAVGVVVACIIFTAFILATWEKRAGGPKTQTAPRESLPEEAAQKDATSSCAACGIELPREAKYCHQCGKPKTQ